ncbi:MAG: PQQ-dependent sugar dehydrogenase [Acidobacteriota bacterium]
MLKASALILATCFSLLPACQAQSTGPLLTGQAAFTDYSQQAPGVRHKLTVADLPAPAPEQSVQDGPKLIPRPADAWPIAPPGFKVTLYAGGDSTPLQRADATEHMSRSKGTFTQPRLIRTAPNGDIFLSDSGAGEIIILRGTNAEGKVTTLSTYASGLDHPFGIAFFPAGPKPKYVYIGNATSVVRFAYKNGDLHAGTAETVVPTIPGYAQLMGGGHWTRDVVFTKDGKHMLVSVGSGSNAMNPDTDFERNGDRQNPIELHRADILEYTPDGHFEQVYAHGIRNCVGEAINPITGSLWCSVNERDVLGNHLVPDYVTSVPEHSFFGWPWYYMGGHQDPRLPQPCANGTGPNMQRSTSLTAAEAKDCKHVDMSKEVRTPDVLVQPHMASLEMVFYPPIEKRDAAHAGSDFPWEYQGAAFAAEHGSWNRNPRAGYEVISIPMKNGVATGEYDDFLTGFVTKDGHVWGRPVGVTIGNDGSLFVTDDGTRSVWHVTYVGK